jgi:hypothetical protein
MDSNISDVNLNYKQINKEDIMDMSIFLNRIFGTTKFSKEYLDKMYFKNNNSAIGLNVFSGSKIIAHYCLVRRTYRYFGLHYEVGWSVNTAVDESFRGRGFFIDLATRSYELAKNLGLVAIVGVANRKSTRLFLDKLGFEDRGMVRWNCDFFAEYFPRRTWPLNFDHLRLKTFSINTSLYLLSYPFIKIFDASRFSFMSIYLTNRSKKRGLSVTLPQNWFRSNWQVITLNLSPDDNGVQKFLDEFSIDIAESDTF